MAAWHSSRPSDDVLARIISTVGSSLELDEVLRAVVRLLSEASAVHACFVYLVEDDGERLVLRAAGEPYEHLIGKIALERPRGPRLVGGRAQRAGVHPRQPARRSARRVRSRARGGALPVAAQRADRRARRHRDRRHQRPHRGAARVHPGRGRLPRHERLARRRRDRERAALRRDARAGARARGDHRARRGDRRRADTLDELLPEVAAPGARAPAGARLPPLPARAGQRGARAAGVGSGERRGARDASGSPSSARSSRAAGEPRASPCRSSRATSCSACSSPSRAPPSSSRGPSPARSRSGSRRSS